MKKVANKITRYLFGIDCYPSNRTYNYIPTFKTLIPEGYDPYNCDQFNKWAENIHSSLRTK